VFGVTGILMAIIIAATVPREFSDASETEVVTSASGRDAPSSALLSRNVLLVTAAFFLVGTGFVSYTSLYATYLHDLLGFSVSEAGTSLGMYHPCKGQLPICCAYGRVKIVSVFVHEIPFRLSAWQPR
jgi:predicted MFS family arabinose efflux permease